MSPPQSSLPSETVNDDFKTMSPPAEESPRDAPSHPRFSPGRLAQIACLLEVAAAKPGNVHRYADFADLHFTDFLLSATAIADPLDQARTTGIGASVMAAIEATRRVVDTNTNLGIVLLLAPLAAVAEHTSLADGIESVLAATTVEDAMLVYRAIRLAVPGSLGSVPDQDVAAEPTVTLRAAMNLAADRDLIARQYANGFHEVLFEALPALTESLQTGASLETAIVASFLHVVAHYPDSLIARKHGLSLASEVSRRALGVLEAGWPERDEACRLCDDFDAWLRHPQNRFNPGATADLVTAAVYAALRDDSIRLPGPARARVQSKHPDASA
jgi:triphosphoribosyl-dephospho-CoA synthase